MVTEADENYLKEIYTLSSGQESVTTSMLAECFGYSPATITGMLKKMAAKGWVDYEPYRGVKLTESGTSLALSVLRRHRLMETFLVNILQVPWERVHTEAERLEHAISHYLEERIDELLGYPQFDPHGSPIPAADGSMPSTTRQRLSEISAGTWVEIAEVPDRNAELLQYLENMHLYPKVQCRVQAIDPIDGLITLLIDGEQKIVGQTSARQIFVNPISKPVS